MNQLCANRSTSIGSLKSKIFPETVGDFLFKGQLMTDQGTLDYYGVQAGDIVVAIQGKTQAELKNSHKERDEMICRESLRMRDLLMRRREGRPRAQRKFITAVMRQLGQSLPKAVPSPTVISGWEPSIGTSPLPVIW
jgi:hypothetical protein